MSEEKKESSQEPKGPRPVSFSEFLMMLSTQTLMQLGVIPNPLTQKTRVDLQGAQVTIEAIAMLKDKTKGNLTDEEGKAIDNALHNLQMRYVEIVRVAGTNQSKTGKK